jgi:hypothetical protein
MNSLLISWRGDKCQHFGLQYVSAYYVFLHKQQLNHHLAIMLLKSNGTNEE